MSRRAPGSAGGARLRPRDLASVAAAFRRDARGSIAMMFGFAAPVVLLVIGLSLDFGRATLAQRELQHALEAAVEASELRLELLDDELYRFASHELSANIGPAATAALESFTFTRSADGVTTEAVGRIATPFMSALGSPSMTYRAAATLTY